MTGKKLSPGIIMISKPMKTNCLIVDDEPLARALIRNYLEKLSNFNIVGEYSNAMKALYELQNKPVDLMFLDIRLPQITGLDFLKILKKPPRVVITTAYREYAVESFELDVVDYLLKPVSFERFLKSINKYYQLAGDEQDGTSHAAVRETSPESFIYLKENKKMVKVSFDEILYIEGFSEYVKVYTRKGRIITKTSMNSMEEKLALNGFMRIHKSWIVSTSKIDAFTANSVEINGKELPVGRSYKNAVAAELRTLHKDR